MTNSVLADVLDAREGHFEFESGHHGRLWLELDRLFLRPARLRPVIDVLAQRVARYDVTAVCGPLTGGAFVAQQVAMVLDTRFFPAERCVAGTTVDYRIPESLCGSVPGQRFAVVDDALNAGSAVRKCVRELRDRGGEVVVAGGILALGSGAHDMAGQTNVPLETVETWPHELWNADDCPLCEQGQALTV